MDYRYLFLFRPCPDRRSPTPAFAQAWSAFLASSNPLNLLAQLQCPLSPSCLIGFLLSCLFTPAAAYLHFPLAHALCSAPWVFFWPTHPSAIPLDSVNFLRKYIALCLSNKGFMTKWMSEWMNEWTAEWVSLCDPLLPELHLPLHRSMLSLSHTGRAQPELLNYSVLPAPSG